VGVSWELYSSGTSLRAFGTSSLGNNDGMGICMMGKGMFIVVMVGKGMVLVGKAVAVLLGIIKLGFVKVGKVKLIFGNIKGLNKSFVVVVMTGLDIIMGSSNGRVLLTSRSRSMDTILLLLLFFWSLLMRRN